MSNFKYPKILHLYWDGSPLSYLNFLTVLSFNKYNKNWKIMIYTPTNRTTNMSWKSSEQKLIYNGRCYFKKLSDIENVIFQKVNLDEIGFNNNASEVIKSDYFRYYILQKYGGLWSDFDIIYTGSIEEKMNFTEDNVIFHCKTYYPIGLLMCVPDSKLFKYILSHCKQYYNVNTYQCIGASMWNNLFKTYDDLYKIDSVKICNKDYYLPWEFNQIDGFLTKKDNVLPPNNIGIHWFNGATKSKQYAIDLDGRLENFNINCYLDRHVNEYIGYDQINKWIYKKIPKIMFTYWHGPMSYLHYISLKSFVDLNPDWKVQLYYPLYPGTLKPSWSSSENSVDYKGYDWYIELKKLNIEFISIDFTTIDFYNEANEVIKSDYLRLYILSTQGGLWSDSDILYLKPMPSLLLSDHLINGEVDKIDTVISYHHILKYYSIGYILSSSNNTFFSYILNQTKTNYNPKCYESIGGFLYKKLFPDPQNIIKMFPNINLVNIGLDIVYPFPSWNTKDLFYNDIPIDFQSETIPEFERILKINRYPKNFPIQSKASRTIGIHWFNGHNKAKQFINEANYNTNVTINKVFKQYIERKVFIIPTCSTDENIPSTCIRCIKSIRKLYPLTDIILINDSILLDDNKIYNFFADNNLSVTQPEVKGSGCSYALNLFNNLTKYDKAIILQDSTELINKLDTDFDIKFFWYFTEHLIWHKTPVPVQNAQIKTHEDEIIEFHKNLSDSPFKTNFLDFYNQKENWRGCLGNMAILSKEFLVRLENETKILTLTNSVKTRRDRMCMESIFAMAVFYVKQFVVNNEDEYSLERNWNDLKITKYDNNNGPSGKYIIKYSYGR